ncbi:glycosyltransferase [Pedobacter cryoconitis]|uniref:UDP:flavonoid glycosyltransferase YjiC (YdhE family) n=1 Tax=Pedobacter cryoconitis TaxID=188932 RepID=A0A7X0J177_9SPHI|nr:glycosyltransferase [Pedobacter cryoconitis]MBB6499050.1 UDP:flavonoid glycosyltransferase YjiC (YdhE family) [Pedobacter cryoconitis]
MNKVLIIQYPSLSHLNASFKIAKILKNNGYEVFYFMPKDFYNHVNNNHFHFYSSDTFPFGVDADISLARQMKIDYNYFDKLKNKSSALFYDLRKGELNAAVDTIKPTVIIADTFAGTDFLLLYTRIKSLGIKFFYLETMLSSIGNASHPYLNSRSMPHQKTKIRLEHFFRLLSKNTRQIFYKTFYLGQDELSVLNRKIKEEGLPAHYKLDELNFFDLIFKNIPSLLTSPIELEFFNTPQHDNHHYLGLFVDKNRIDITIDDRLDRIVTKGRKVVYISFGTVFGEHRVHDIFSLMKKLNKVAGQLTEVDFIFSLGKKKWEEKYLRQLSNVHIFPYVPQLWMLKNANIFITHGGLNSIKESLAIGVPLLVYPIDIDQIGNARKIASKKIGLFGDLKKDSVKMIRNKIVQLLGANDYRNNMETIMSQIDNKYKEEELVLNLINNYSPIV